MRLPPGARVYLTTIVSLAGVGLATWSGMRAGAAQREIPEGVAFETLGATEQRTIALRIVRREMGVMTIAALLIVAFAIRAAQTSGGF